MEGARRRREKGRNDMHVPLYGIEDVRSASPNFFRLLILLRAYETSRKVELEKLSLLVEESRKKNRTAKLHGHSLLLELTTSGFDNLLTAKSMSPYLFREHRRQAASEGS